jgi:hypothetical protein
VKYLRACLDPRVLAALGAAGVAIWVLAPGLVAAVIPLLILAACPLSMLVMMRSMSRHSAMSAGGEHELALRRELAELHERQRQLESQLAESREGRERLSEKPLRVTPRAER